MRYLIEYFIRFRQLIGRKVYNLLALMFVVGFVEGLGITLFLPILQNGFGEDKLSQGLKIIFNALRIGFSFNILLILIMVFFILRSVFLISYARYFGRLSAGLAIALRWKVLRGIFDADYLYTLKKETGYINNAITHEIACVVDAFNTFSRMLGNGILALIYIGISLSVNFRVTMAVILLAPIIAIFMKRINRLTNMASVGLTASQGKFHSILIQVLSKIKYLKATFSVPRVRDIINRVILFAIACKGCI